MLALDFVKANRETVERAIRDKGVDARPRRAAARSTRKCARSRPRSTACGPSATRSAPSSRTRTPEEKAELGRQAKEAGARASQLEGELADKEAALKALMLQASRHSLRGRAGRAGRELQRGHPHRRRAAEVRLRAARPCRADREERLGRPVAGHAGVGHRAPTASRARLALLETKLMAWALEKIASAGFTPITVPAIAREQAFLNQGQFPGHRGRNLRAAQRRSVARRDRRGGADLAPFGRDHRGRQAADPLRRLSRPASAARREARARTCAGCCASTSS